MKPERLAMTNDGRRKDYSMSVLDRDTLAWDSLPELRRQTTYAWDVLGECRQYSIIADANTLYASFNRARKGTAWKESVQKFSWYRLKRITAIQEGLYRLEHGLPDAYKPSNGYEFVIYERGRKRLISGQTVADRVVSHALNDYVLIPAVKPYLIYDNTASLQGRGVDMARRRLRAHLEAFYHREGSNRGYIRLKDLSKYYDNIHHDKLREIIQAYVTDALALKLVDQLLTVSRVDVSHMSNDEYARCMNERFDRLAYTIEHPDKLGIKLMGKGMSVGDQFSQTAGIVYPYRVDSLAKIVLSSKYYARYMDDSYDIDRDLTKLKARGAQIDAESKRYGMFTNERKTCIARIDKGFIYLQRKVRLRADGSIEIKLRPESVTHIKRRIRKLSKKVQAGALTTGDVTGMVRSWICARRDCLTYPQLRTIEQTVLKYYGREAYEQVYDHAERWKAA